MVQWLNICLPRDNSSIPSLGRSQRPQSNLSSIITEACTPRASGPRKEKPLQWEVHAPHLESSCHSLQLEKAPPPPTHTRARAHTHTHIKGWCSEPYLRDVDSVSIPVRLQLQITEVILAAWSQKGFDSNHREGRQTFGEGIIGCSGQRCFTRILWCQEFWQHRHG